MAAEAANEAALALLLAASPVCAARPDKQGRLPLHYAAASACPLPQFTVGIERSSNDPGDLARRPGAAVAPAPGLSAASVEALLKAHPAAAMHADRLGRTPLHEATEAGCGEAVITVLLAGGAEAAKAKVRTFAGSHLSDESCLQSSIIGCDGR